MLENDEILLRKPTLADEKIVLDFKKEFDDNNEKMYGAGSLAKAASYADWLAHLEECSADVQPEGRVPATEFLSIRKSDDKLLGLVNVRHYLNDVLLVEGGHIGDCVRPSERGKGYGTQQIGLALKFCKKIGVKKVLITCVKTNIGSAKTIIKNGGVLENEVECDDGLIQRYWIENDKEF